MLSNILDRIAFWSIFTVIVLLPIFFAPFTKIPVEASKTVVLVVGLVVAVVAWSAARFSDGKIVIPRSPILFGGIFVVLATLLSSIFSDNRAVSFFGSMLDTGTFWFILAAFVLLFLSSSIIRTEKQSRMVLYGIISSFLILFTFQILRYFLPEALSFDILGGKTANLFGAWNGFGYVAGLGSVISVFLIELGRVSKRIKIVAFVLLALSVFTMMAVSLVQIWELVGLATLFIFIYKIATFNSNDKAAINKNFPTYAFSLVILSLLFFLSGRFIGNWLPNTLGISNIEISPALNTTFSVGKQALIENPVFGMGANRFNIAWSMWKPQIINNTQFWDTPFGSGFGFLPTAAINTGILGILSWILFIGLFLVFGVKHLIKNLQNKPNSTSVLYFVLGLFMLTASFMYSFGVAGIMLVFVCIGMFLSKSSLEVENGWIEFNFLNDPRKSFVSILLLVVLMLSAAGLCFKFVERFASVHYFNRALVATDVKTAEAALGRAIDLHNNDLYLRTLVQVELANISILAQQKEFTTSDQNIFQSSFDKAVSAANSAIKYDNKNYLNHQILGITYSTVGRLGVEGVGEMAINAYEEASKLNPLNPGLKLAIASEYLVIDKHTEAKNYAEEALNLAPNYVDALTLLAQVEKNLGNTSKAGEYLERALVLDPSNKNLADYAKSIKSTPVVSESTETSKSDKEE